MLLADGAQTIQWILPLASIRLSNINKVRSGGKLSVHLQ